MEGLISLKETFLKNKKNQPLVSGKTLGVISIRPSMLVVFISIPQKYGIKTLFEEIEGFVGIYQLPHSHYTP